MPRIIFKTSNAAEQMVEAEAGLSVMEVAVRHGIGGIDGDCGGAAACGTCHVHVDEVWLARLQEANEGEIAMLQFVDDARPQSRLSCQIPVTAELDGLIVTLPDAQH